MYGLPPRVLAIADAGGGRVSRRDLTSQGITKAEIQAWLYAGIFVSAGFGEYRVAGSGLTFEQEIASRLWRCGDGALVGASADYSAAGKDHEGTREPDADRDLAGGARHPDHPNYRGHDAQPARRGRISK